VSGQAPKPRRFWLNVGEAVGVLALLIAGLSYWDNRRQHADDKRQAAREAAARSTFVATGAADAGGRRIVISALKPGQAIVSQRYVFPGEVLDHAMEVEAARPQIDLAWIEGGLRHALESARVKGAGEARLPVAIATTYVDGEATRQDLSLYRVGFAWKPRLFGGPEVRLQGLALSRRGLSGDARLAADAAWRAGEADFAGR